MIIAKAMTAMQSLRCLLDTLGAVCPAYFESFPVAPTASIPGSTNGPLAALSFSEGRLFGTLKNPDDSFIETNQNLNAKAALQTLQKWYNTTSGIWDTTGWWNSANCLTVVADFAALDPSVEAAVHSVFHNTLIQAPKTNLGESKIITNGLIQVVPKQGSAVLPAGFLNDYYDDEGWWAMGLIRVFDVTQDLDYLHAAANIFEDMKAGQTTPCGGIWWNKDHSATVAIANELFLNVAASLSNRASALGDQNKTKLYYLSTALKQWSWFARSGLINKQGTINDGLDQTTCKNNNGIIWSYNQGVILGALVELNNAVRSHLFIDTARSIASAAIEQLSDSNGILRDVCESGTTCGADGSQFKGVFMRNLQILYRVSPDVEFKEFIEKNAASIWANDRGANDKLSLKWAGPYVQPANASTQSSALDTLVAAVAVERLIEA